MNRDMQNKVFIPFMRSVITGFFFGLAGFSVGLLLDLQMPVSIYVGLLIASVAAIISWLRLVFWAESVLGVDLNRDGKIGGNNLETAEAAPTLYYKINEHQTKLFHFDIDPDRLDQFILDVVSGISMAESNWTGLSKPFSRHEYRHLRQQMIDYGLVVQTNEKDAKQGFSLTAMGEQVFRNNIKSPLPQEVLSIPELA